MSNQSLIRSPFLFYLKKNWRPLCFGLGTLVITDSLDAITPLILKAGMDAVQEMASSNEILKNSVLFFAVMSVLSITRYGWRVGLGEFQTRSTEHLRSLLFKHMTKLSAGWFQKNPVGKLMAYYTSEVEAFRNMLSEGVLTFTDSIIMLSLLIPLMSHLNPQWTWKAVLFFPLMPFATFFLMKTLFQRYKDQQEANAILTANIQENINGIRTIKGYAQESNRLEKYNLLSKKYELACNRTNFADALFMPVFELGVTLGTIAFLFAASEDLFTGAVSVGTFMAFHRYIFKMSWPMMAMGLGISQFQKGFGAFKRIKEILITETDINDNGTKELKSIDHIEFKNVCYRYPDQNENCLSNISFTLMKNESLGVLGPVGSGKSTLAHLLCRQIEPTSGEILINGFNYQEYTITSLRNQICLVPQDVFLFSDTIEQNIQFGSDENLSTDYIFEKLKNVDIASEVSEFPLKTMTVIGEKGINLSGGQKQRLALARGLAKKSTITILDDVLSAVDHRTEKMIEQTFKDLKKNNSSAIFISHRLSTVELMDKIIVLDHGKLEAIGTHEMLKAQSPFYQELMRLQGAE